MAHGHIPRTGDFGAESACRWRQRALPHGSGILLDECPPACFWFVTPTWTAAPPRLPCCAARTTPASAPSAGTRWNGCAPGWRMSLPRWRSTAAIFCAPCRRPARRPRTCSLACGSCTRCKRSTAGRWRACRSKRCGAATRRSGRRTWRSATRISAGPAASPTATFAGACCALCRRLRRATGTAACLSSRTPAWSTRCSAASPAGAPPSGTSAPPQLQHHRSALGWRPAPRGALRRLRHARRRLNGAAMRGKPRRRGAAPAASPAVPRARTRGPLPGGARRAA